MPRGLWDANKIQVVARMVQDGNIISEVPLSYAGTKSTFAGQVSLPKAGSFELQVLAMEPANANFGMIRRTVTVTP